eukprot:24605_4
MRLQLFVSRELFQDLCFCQIAFLKHIGAVGSRDKLGVRSCRIRAAGLFIFASSKTCSSQLLAVKRLYMDIIKMPFCS